MCVCHSNIAVRVVESEKNDFGRKCFGIGYQCGGNSACSYISGSPSNIECVSPFSYIVLRKFEIIRVASLFQGSFPIIFLIIKKLNLH